MTATALATRCVLAGHPIGRRGQKGDERLSLNDIWKAAGSPPHKDPRQWLRQEDTRAFIALQAKWLNVGLDHIIETRRGHGGGSWAHWTIGVKYAAYLSKQLEDDLIRAWRQLKEEERDPGLAADMSFFRIKQYYMRQMGYSEPEAEEMAAQRLIGKANRNLLTGEWNRRGAKYRDFGPLTNAGYLGLFNQTAADMRQAQGLPVRANMRNHMPLDRLAQTSLHEVLTRERLRHDNVYGPLEMSKVSHTIGTQLAQAVAQIRCPAPRRLPSGVKGPNCPRPRSVLALSYSPN